MSMSRHFYAILGLATVLTATSVSSTHMRGGAAPSQPSNVLVVNSANQPVPTSAQGTTTVGGTVAVSNLPATQAVSGSVAVNNFPTSQDVTVGNFPATQSVSVSGTPTVTVGNAPSSPVPVREDISNRTPFSQTDFLSMQVGQFGQVQPVLTVPAGKILEVRDITVLGDIPSTNDPQGILRALVSFQGANYFVPLIQTGLVGNGSAEFSGALTGCSIVLTSGQELDAVFSRSSGLGQATGQITVVGFLVDAP